MGTRIETTDAMFATVAEMLRFAYAMPCHVICKTQKFDDTAGGVGELTPHDYHAQASMIRAEVDLLPWIERNVIIAYYSNDPMEKQQARSAVITWLIRQQGTGMHLVRLYNDVVQMYAGEGITVRDLADRYKLSVGTAHNRKVALFRLLDQPYWAARGILRQKLVGLLRLS